MKVEIVRAWPRRYESMELDLPEGARVVDAVAAAGWSDDAQAVAYAVFGVSATEQTVLNPGDRVELLRPLQTDPKEARRRRAEARSGRG